jgi:hypothetical protein
MHGVHAFQEWLILAAFRTRYLREMPGEREMGAILRSGLGGGTAQIELRAFPFAVRKTEPQRHQDAKGNPFIRRLRRFPQIMILSLRGFGLPPPKAIEKFHLR